MIRSAFTVSAREAATWFRICPEVSFGPESESAGVVSRPETSRVLIVEDDYFVAMEIETTLMDMHCDIVGIAATGEEAIALAERENPDLVLMDVRLAGMLDGIEAAAVIYARFGIRSLFVTAHSDSETRKRGDAANPVGWASKPFSSNQLSSSVKAALDTLGARR